MMGNRHEPETEREKIIQLIELWFERKGRRKSIIQMIFLSSHKSNQLDSTD